ncbi:hypothetical protein [Actibacterium sp. XHP0104]|nr:hypothetical protein [Actibacterium sp. XHP0104]MCV2881122.1 hypothetical protein [Actibacterium sp. XHP0104]
MLSDLKTLMTRSSALFMQDLVGVTALMVMLFVGLHLPGFL